MAQGSYAHQNNYYDSGYGNQGPSSQGQNYGNGYHQDYDNNGYGQYSQNPYAQDVSSYQQDYGYNHGRDNTHYSNGNHSPTPGYGQGYEHSLPYREKQLSPSSNNGQSYGRSNAPNGYNGNVNDRNGGYPQQPTTNFSRNGAPSSPPNGQYQAPPFNSRDEQNAMRSGDFRHQGSEQHYQELADSRTPQRAELYDDSQDFQPPAAVTGFYGQTPRPGTAPNGSDRQRPYQGDSNHDTPYGKPTMRREVSDSSANPRQRQQQQFDNRDQRGYGNNDIPNFQGNPNNYDQDRRGLPYSKSPSPQPRDPAYTNGSHGYNDPYYGGQQNSRKQGDGVFEMPGDLPRQGGPNNGYDDRHWNQQDHRGGYDGYSELDQYGSHGQDNQGYPLRRPELERNATNNTSHSDPSSGRYGGGPPPNSYGAGPYDQNRRGDPRMKQPPSREDMRRQRTPRDHRDPRDNRDPRDTRDRKSPRDPRDPRSGRGPRDGRDPRDRRGPDPRDDRNGYDPRGGSQYPPDDRQRQRRDRGPNDRPRDKPRPNRGPNGEPFPPQPQSAGPTTTAFPADARNRNRPTSPYDRPSTAPGVSSARPPPQGPPGSNNGPLKAGQPPIRAGLQPNPNLQPARPPPVRNYNMNSSQGADVSNNKEKDKSSRRKSEPITQDTLSRLRTQANSSPNDNKLQFKLATSLVEASKVLADEGGRADPATRSRNKKRYVSEALPIVRKLSAAGDTDAMFFLADSYSTGALGLDNDPKDAFNLYQNCAKAGHPVAAYRTAVCCEIGPDEGGGTRKDVLKAVQWYKRAANLGDVPAMYKLGMISLNGLLSQEKNTAEGLRWLKAAADKADEENPHALHELGLLYETGAHSGLIPKDEGYACQLFTKSSKLGYRFSQFKLGKAYEFGELGCPIDARSSIVWYTKAAAQGEHQSELALSGWYLTGSEGILEHSDTEAYLWARKAASANPPLPKALFALGYYLEVGIGATRSLDEAKKWYGRAASYGFPKAQERLEELRKGGARAQKGRERLSRSNPKKTDAECTVM